MTELEPPDPDEHLRQPPPPPPPPPIPPPPPPYERGRFGGGFGQTGQGGGGYQRGQFRGGMGGPAGSAVGMRYAFLSVGIVLGILLIASGNFVIGIFFAGYGIVRLAMFSAIRRQRQGGGARAGGSRRDDAPTIGGSDGLRGFVRDEFIVAARIVGITPAALRREFTRGQSISEIAAANRVSRATVIEAITVDVTRRLDAEVQLGRLDAGQAIDLRARIPDWAAQLVDARRGDLRGRA